MKLLAFGKHDDPRVAIQASDFLAKHGWPREGIFGSVVDDKAPMPKTVILELRNSSVTA